MRQLIARQSAWWSLESSPLITGRPIRMGPDELSTEMALWRERESQHNLELYKKEAAMDVTDKVRPRKPVDHP